VRPTLLIAVPRLFERFLARIDSAVADSVVKRTLLRMTMAYSMLANGALEVTPSLVDRVQDRNGRTIYRHETRTCRGCGLSRHTPGISRTRRCRRCEIARGFAATSTSRPSMGTTASSRRCRLAQHDTRL
jgi:membrane carboxypeptidase/penicillin-binding protein